MDSESTADNITLADMNVKGHGIPHHLDVLAVSSTGRSLTENDVGSGISSTDIGYDGAPPVGFDIDNFLQLEAHLDLGYLLALPNDPNAGLVSGLGSVSAPNIPTGNGAMGTGFASQGFAYGADVAPEYAGEFGVGMGGLGNLGPSMFPGDGSTGWMGQDAGDVGE
jgi:hypothetical protein